MIIRPGILSQTTDSNNLLANLISYWEMDDVSGNRLDSHGDNDLVVGGAGISNSGDATVFNGTDSYMTNGDLVAWNTITTEFTLITKLYGNEITDGFFKAIATRYNSSTNNRMWDLIRWETGKLQCRVWENGGNAAFDLVESDAAINNDQWYNVSVIFKTQEYLKLIIDDTVKSDTTAVITDIHTAAGATAYDLNIGRFNGLANPYQWIGQLKDMAIWNRSLSEEEAALAHSLTYAQYQLAA